LSTGAISIGFIIYASSSILPHQYHQEETFIHTYNNCTGNVITTPTMTSETASVWHYVMTRYLCVPFPKNNTDYTYTLSMDLHTTEYSDDCKNFNNKRQIVM